MSKRAFDRNRLVKLIRFAIVGGFNTALDFVLLFLFVYAAHLNEYVGNILSTGICLVISFVLNRTWTFRSNGNQRRQFVAFLLVTLVGLWGLQTGVIYVIVEALSTWLEGPTLLLVAKLVATVASLIWNFVLYDRLVFRDQVSGSRRPLLRRFRSRSGTTGQTR